MKKFVARREIEAVNRFNAKNMLTVKNVPSKFYALIVVVGICILNLPFLSFNTIICSDEYSAVGIPVYLAGYDWSSEMAGAVWHGTGFTMWLAPFFYFIHDFTTVYHIGLILCLILLCISGICIFNMLNDKIGLNNPLLAAGISIVSVSGVLEAGNGYGLSLMNEVPLSAISILIAYLLMYNGQNTKKNIIHTVLLALLLGYAAIVHSRCLIILVAVLVFELIDCLGEKTHRKWIRLVSLMIGFGVVYIILTNLNKQLLLNMGLGSALSTTSDTTTGAMASSLVRAINNISHQIIRIWWVVRLFLSLTATMNLISGGLFAIATAGLIAVFFGANTDWKCKCLILYLFVLMHGMNFCIALKCNGSIQANNYKWLTYIRYARAFAPLYIAMGLGFLYVMKARAITTVIGLSMFFCAITAAVYKSVVTPILLESGFYNNYSLFGMMFSIKVSKNDMIKIFSIFLFAMFFLSALYCIWLKRKKLTLICLIFFVFSIIVNLGHFDFYKKKDIGYSLMVNSTTETINDLEKQELLSEANIYYMGGDKYNRYLRLALFWVNMLNELPDTENYIFFTNDTKIESKDYIIALDDDEYLITDMEYIAELLLETNEFRLIQGKEISMN